MRIVLATVILAVLTTAAHPAEPVDPVAVVLNRPITSAELEQAIVGHLNSRIFPPLLEQFQKEHDIVVTDEEIAQFLKDMPMIRDEEMPEVGRRVAEAVILQWKTSKALYEKYGGPVIFQQGNPREPMGAYGALMRAKEASGELKIAEPYRAMFWRQFEPERLLFVVPKEEIDYSTPWWRQKPPEDAAPGTERPVDAGKP